MYGNEAGQQVEKCISNGLRDRDIIPPTVGENIDRKIADLQRMIKGLEESKVTLAPLLAMKISDLREAMNY